MRCSIEVEKEMINGHLKYLVFYFGEFNCVRKNYNIIKRKAN